jgi:Tol biopolymer transport system component
MGFLNSMDASSANVSFQWGASSGNYTGETPAQTTETTGAFYADLSTLTPNTNYYYRARAISGNVTANGFEKSFITRIPPAVTTGNATAAIQYNSFNLSGTLASLGDCSSPNVTFEWGNVSGNLTRQTSIQQKFSSGSFVSSTTDDLSANTTYYYRAKVVTPDITVYGNELSFNTARIIVPAPVVELTKYFGNPGIEEGHSIQQTSDGGYIIAGFTSAFDKLGHTDVYLVKTDDAGTTIWSRNINAYGSDSARAIRQTADGGYILTGFKGAAYGLQDVYLVKVDTSGNVTWSQSFNAGNYDSGTDVQCTADNGYIVVTSPLYLLKTNDTGNLTWSRDLIVEDYDSGYSVQQTADGGYILTGSSISYSGDKYVDLLLIKTDASGNVTWRKTFGGTGFEEGRYVQQTSDGGYLVVGTTTSYGAGGYDVYLLKTDAEGKLLWSKTLGSTYDEHAMSARQTDDGGYIITGYIDYSTGRYMFLLKTDDSGNRVFGNWYSTVNAGSSVQQTFDGGYVLTGGRYLMKVTAEEGTLQVRTNAADNVTMLSARLNGRLSALGSAASANVSFEWGDVSGFYASETPAQILNSTGRFSADIPGLSSNTTYFFRAKARGEVTRYGLEKRLWTGLLTTISGEIAFDSAQEGNSDIYILKADGSGQNRLTFDNGSNAYPSWSPDGKQIVFSSSRSGTLNIYTLDLAGGALNRLTVDPRNAINPVWSPDGNTIAFISDRDGTSQIYLMDTDGGNQRRLTNLTNTYAGQPLLPSWSPDGKHLAFVASPVSEPGNWDIYAIDVDGTNLLHLTTNPSQDCWPAWSPCGTRIGFASFRDGNWDFYIMNSDGSNQNRVTTNANIHGIAWSPDGSKIAYTSAFYPGILDLFIMDANGSNPIRITDHAYLQGTLSWLNESRRPTVVTNNATDIAKTSAILNGTVTSLGSSDSVTASFEWGLTSGNYSFETAPVSLSGPSSFSANISGLASGARYYFRAMAIGDATGYGEEISFTTPDAASVVVSVVLQGSSRPDPAGWSVPLTVKFFASGNITPVDVLNAAPVFSFNTTAIKDLNTCTANVTGVIPGVYDITAISPHTLLNVKRNVVISGNDTLVNTGTLLEGNANDDNKVNINDFGLLVMTYGKQRGQDGFDESADFDRNDKINIMDFGLLAYNYGKYSPIEAP